MYDEKEAWRRGFAGLQHLLEQFRTAWTTLAAQSDSNEEHDIDPIATRVNTMIELGDEVMRESTSPDSQNEHAETGAAHHKFPSDQKDPK